MRLFFGLSLPDAVRNTTAAYARTLQGRIPARYTLPENHHLTLAFLGHVDGARLPEVHEILRRTVSRHSAPVLTLGSFGYFSKPQNAILVLHVHSSPDLLPLHKALVDALAQNTLPYDPGPFSPHITLARHARLDDEALSHLPVPEACTFTASHACLFLSARDEQDVLRYTPLVRFPFACGDPLP